MTTDLIERLEQPEYTGENRCGACTAVNLLLAAALAALLGRRNRALGLLAFVGSAALIYLRGYLVPGTPELTKRYLPPSVLALFGKDERPEGIDPSLAQHAADRAADDGPVPVDVRGPDEDADATTVDGRGDGSDPEDGDEIEGTEADAPGASEADDSTADAPEEPLTDDSTAADAEVSREDVEALLEQPMDEVLEDFAVVEEDEAGEDLVLVNAFRSAWEGRIDALADDEDARRETFADVVDRDAADIVIEQRDDDRYYALLDGRSAHNWITEAAMLSDLAAHEALEDPRWGVLDPGERLAVLRGFRVFLTTCPECGGPVSATDDVVESCCGSWDVVAVECGDCGARVLELEAPDSGPDELDPVGGFSR